MPPKKAKNAKYDYTVLVPWCIQRGVTGQNVKALLKDSTSDLAQELVNLEGVAEFGSRLGFTAKFDKLSDIIQSNLSPKKMAHAFDGVDWREGAQADFEEFVAGMKDTDRHLPGKTIVPQWPRCERADAHLNASRGTRPGSQASSTHSARQRSSLPPSKPPGPKAESNSRARRPTPPEQSDSEAEVSGATRQQSPPKPPKNSTFSAYTRQQAGVKRQTSGALSRGIVLRPSRTTGPMAGLQTKASSAHRTREPSPTKRGLPKVGATGTVGKSSTVSYPILPGQEGIGRTSDASSAPATQRASRMPGTFSANEEFQPSTNSFGLLASAPDIDPSSAAPPSKNKKSTRKAAAAKSLNWADVFENEHEDATVLPSKSPSEVIDNHFEEYVNPGPEQVEQEDEDEDRPRTMSELIDGATEASTVRELYGEFCAFYEGMEALDSKDVDEEWDDVDEE